MVKFLLVALLGTVAVPAQSQASSPAVSIEPSADTPAERQVLRNLSMCLAQLRPDWARGVLEHPYLSSAQASAAAVAVSGRDNCQKQPEVEIEFRTSTLVSALAEYFLRADLPRIDSGRIGQALTSVPARNATEDLGLCLASRNFAAARDLALSDPGTSAEASAARGLGAQVTACSLPGESLKVDLQSLRAIVTVALYRAVTSVSKD
jgi:hypothetical protein